MINPSQQKQLFLDDAAVAQLSGVTRRLHQPASHEPVIRPDRTQGQVAVQSRSAPQWNGEKGLWEWWYWGYYRVPPHGSYPSTTAWASCYATSHDGSHWVRPTLGLYEWRGSRQNNIACDPAAPRMLYHIIRDEQEADPARRYKALFDVHDRYLGVSPDGFTWTMLAVPPIPSQDESHFLYDASTGEYLAFVKQPTAWGRSVWLATSTDFQHFSTPQLVFSADEIDQQQRRLRVQQVVDEPAYLAPPLVNDAELMAQVYQMAVLPYAGRYIGFPVLFNPAGAIPPPHMNYTGLNQVELTVSSDRLHWQRVAERALFLPVDPWQDQSYGWAQKLLCGTPHIHDNREIWLYYNALRFRGPRELYKDIADAYFEEESALILAKLRLDGFVSLVAEQAGTIVTQPFHANGGQLTVNAEADQGDLRAELVDASTGQPLIGYTAADAVPIQSDQLAGALGWRTQTSLPPGQTVQVRFYLQRAQLYSFWITL